MNKLHNKERKQKQVLIKVLGFYQSVIGQLSSG